MVAEQNMCVTLIIISIKLYLLVKDPCIIFILFLCYIQQLLVLVVVSYLSVAQARILFRSIPINGPSPSRKRQPLTNYRGGPAAHKNMQNNFPTQKKKN